MSTIALPTREEFLKQLSTYPVEACAIIDGDTTSCTICTGVLADTPVNDSEERTVLLHDSHVFGEVCAREWLASNNTCPKCRTVLYRQTDNDDAEAAMDDFVPIPPTFDEGELEHLLWQAGQLSTRHPRTGVFSDHEVMAIFWNLWNQWMCALGDNADGSWELENPRSKVVACALHELLRVRYSWWRHSPQQLNVNITGRFIRPVDSWTPTERDLRRSVVVDFHTDLQCVAFLIRATDRLLVPAFDAGNNCINGSGHPAIMALFDRVNDALQSVAGQRISVHALMQKLRQAVGDADRMESFGENHILPAGYADFVRHLVDQTTLRAIRRTRENRLARRVRRVRLVSRAPRMSAPSTMSRSSRRS